MKKLYAFTQRPWHCIAASVLLLLMLVMPFSTVFAQTMRTIKGTVNDETNTPLPGVTVTVKGTTRATSTDINGKYSIAVNNGDVLRFTSVGSVPKEENANGKTVINITLVSDAKALKDVVVIGYGTSSKKEITSSITTVKADDFNAGVLTTPAELLQGKVAGLNITKSGDPNSTPSTVLRGPSTITGSTEPFYVIDGVPGASIDLLAPADIESIDVLKDASATAIYGNRASNGVIIVTTRHAKSGQNRLNYTSYVSTEAASNQIHVLDAGQLRQYLADNKQMPLIPVLNDDGSDTHWQNLVERRSYSQNQNLSFSGASTTADYGVTANYMTNSGIIKNTSMERVILKGYLNQRFFNDRLKLGLSITNSHTINNNVPVSNVISESVFYLPTVSPYNADGSYKEFFSRTGSGTQNPLSLIYNNVIKNDDNKTLYNGIATVDIIKGLKYTFNASVQNDQTNNSYYYNSQSGIGIGLNGVANKTAYLNTRTVLESYFNYDRYFGKHSVKLVGGYSYEYDKNNNGFGITTQNFTNDALTYNNISLSNPSSLSQISLQSNPVSGTKLISFYGRAQYSFDSKYLFQASLRNDGSSVFGVNNRWGYFPSVSAGWNISDENFMKNIPVIDNLKLRAGYGVAGNSSGIGAFSALVIYGPAGKFLYNGNVTNTVAPVQNDNPNLKWESTATTNIGLDFGILKDRITGSVEYYDKNTSDLLFDKYTVSTTQYFVGTIAANVGKVNNKGIEVTLNFVPVKSKDGFNWNSSLNFAHNRNNVVSLSNDQFQTPFVQVAQVGGKGQSGLYSQRIQPGYPLGTFYLWHYAGKNAAGVSTYQKPDGTITAQQPLSTDAMLTGNAQPNLIYGWNNSFFYKNFDLNFLVRGVIGNKILNGTLAALNDPKDANVQNIPTFTLGESYNDVNAYLVSDRFLESGSYLRLDNATLGYTIRPHNTQTVKSIRLYASGNNLFIITNYRGIDPEINIGGQTPGIDNGNFYPKTRSFLFGVSATF